MTISQSITINATIEHVFDVFTDLGTAKDNLSGIKSLELIKGSENMQVGTRWKETREMMGKDSTETMEVTALEPNKSYTVDAESHGTKYRSVFTFKEVEGGTLVTWVFEGVPQTLGAKLMSLTAVLFKGSLEKMLRKDLEDLKAACEK